MTVVLASASPNATEEDIQKVFDKHGLEREAPEPKEKEEAAVVVTETPAEPNRDDFENDEEFEAAQAEFEEAKEAAAAKELEEEEKKAPRLSRLQRRVQRETAKLRQEADDLRREVEELKKGKGAQPEAKEKAAEENPRPKRDDFKSTEEYEDALLDWGTKQAIAKREAEAAEKSAKEAAEAEQKQLEANYENYREQVEEFKDTHDDWDEVVNREDVPMHKAVQLALLELPNGAELTYYLGKHTEFAEKLAEMPPLSAVAEIGILSRKLQSESGRKPRPSGPATAWGGEPRTATKPKAPEPVRPVRTGTTLSSMTSRDAAKNGDFAAFKRAQRQGK